VSPLARRLPQVPEVSRDLRVSLSAVLPSAPITPAIPVTAVETPLGPSVVAPPAGPRAVQMTESVHARGGLPPGFERMRPSPPARQRTWSTRVRRRGEAAQRRCHPRGPQM
jgi:hypothetical protein